MGTDDLQKDCVWAESCLFNRLVSATSMVHDVMTCMATHVMMQGYSTQSETVFSGIFSFVCSFATKQRNKINLEYSMRHRASMLYSSLEVDAQAPDDR